jgi:cell division protein FtsI/penicillin-binding protein 2
VPLAGVAAIAFAAGALYENQGGGAERQLVIRYVTAWAHDDYAQMYSLLDAADRARMAKDRFIDDYRSAARVATLTSVKALHVGSLNGDTLAVRMRARTVAFGTLHETLVVPLTGTGSAARVRFSSALVFPGLRAGEHLQRTATLGPRGAILADDGTALAEGPTRSSPIPAVAGQIAGTLGPIPAALAPSYQAQGYPPNAKIGLNGLERVFQRQLAGTPGGTLFAGSRVLARTTAVPGHTVRTTISPTIEEAAITAMGPDYAGIAAMDPRTGAVLALAGVAFSALQPPGSTMKIITSTAALAAHLVTLGTTFPYATSATIDGYTLQNANGEDCGGTLINAFAVSCNSVFAPLGAQLGGARLVSMAEKFGFNQPLPIPGAATSEIPSAATIGSNLAVGSSAIGQGMVLASALEMTDVAATIAMGGRRPIPSLTLGATPHFVHVTSRHIARLVQKMMIAVVQYGTGTAAAIPGVTVAGKTGTAELRSTVQSSSSSSANPNAPPPNSPKNTDAWFVGYAPVGAPRIVAGALFPSNGAGGATAAPAVRGVLVAGLQAHR